MQMHAAKRVSIMIEAPMRRRLTQAMEETGITGYTIQPVIGGSGRSGPWSSEGQIGMAGGIEEVICIIRPDRLDPLIEHVFSLVERHIGIVTISDCQVLRAERF